MDGEAHLIRRLAHDVNGDDRGGGRLVTGITCVREGFDDERESPTRQAQHWPGSGIAPVWWTPRTLSREVFSRCPRPVLHTPLSSAGRWLSWSAPAAIRPTSLASSNPRQTIQNWVAEADRVEGRREVKPLTADPDLTMTERDELVRLRRENRQLKLERDILSRATAWFARETGVLPSGSSGS